MPSVFSPQDYDCDSLGTSECLSSLAREVRSVVEQRCCGQDSNTYTMVTCFHPMNQDITEPSGIDGTEESYDDMVAAAVGFPEAAEEPSTRRPSQPFQVRVSAAVLLGW